MALVSCASCAQPTLDLVVAPRVVPGTVAAEIEQLAQETAGLEVEVSVGGGALSNLEAVASGEADLAIVPNNVAFIDDVRTVTTLYTGVLHTLHRREGEPASFAELVDGAKVFAGPPDSMERELLQAYVEHFGAAGELLDLVEVAEDADVLFLFAPVMPEIGRELDSSWQMFSLGEPEAIGLGAPIEAISLTYPQLRPFVIPAQTYPGHNPKPVVTVGVEMLLVAREELDEDEIYALTKGLVTHRRKLATATPALFQGLQGELDGSTLAFPLHEGARQYFERDAPSLFERYAEPIGVSFSIMLASLSGLIALGRWRGRRRKDRIDVYYERILDLREGVEAMTSTQREEARAELRALEVRAFRALIAEELAADEAFRIFVTLVHDTRQDLRDRGGDADLRSEHDGQ